MLYNFETKLYDAFIMIQKSMMIMIYNVMFTLDIQRNIFNRLKLLICSAKSLIMKIELPVLYLFTYIKTLCDF